MLSTPNKTDVVVSKQRISLEYNKIPYEIEIEILEENIILRIIVEDEKEEGNYLAYKGQFNLNELKHLSKFFLMFDNISQASKAIYELIKKKNTEIKKEFNGYDLIVENEILSEKINFNLSKLEQDINWKVENLIKNIKKMKNDSKNKDDQINQLQNDLNNVKSRLDKIENKIYNFDIDDL